jgi:hypothetical protein
MKKKERLGLVLLGLVVSLSLVLAACGPAATEMISPLGTPSSGDSKGATIPDEAKEMADLVTQDLAERLSLAPDQIEIVAVETVEWPDTSLGCPKPGMAYAEVITPGFKFVLQAEGQAYTYHTGATHLVLCQEGKAMDPVTDKDKADEDQLTPKEAALVEQAKADLSERLKVAPEAIELVSVQAVEWPDGSMGCPKPGMNYLMVVTPGYLVILQSGGKIYQYPGNEQAVSYCENPQPPLSSEPGSGEVLSRLVQTAKDDLAQRLSLEAESIQVVKAEAVQWPDASLGCPKPGMMYAQVVTPGYQIVLSAGGAGYDYHASALEVFLCEE